MFKPARLFLVLSLGLVLSSFLWAQQLRSIELEDRPIVIVNDSIIGNFEIILNTAPKEVTRLNIIKDKNLSSRVLFFDNVTSTGLVYAEIRASFEVKSQEELNTFFGLQATNAIYLNGYLLEQKNYCIATDTIKSIELIQADHLTLKKSVLNVLLK